MAALPGSVIVGVAACGCVWAASFLAVAVAEPPRSPGETRAGIFGLEAIGNRFVYVFDHSASMGDPEGRPLAEAKRELLESIEALGDSRQFHVIFYNERLTVFAPSGHRGRPIFADDDNKQAVRRFVEAIDAEGSTRHFGVSMQLNI